MKQDQPNGKREGPKPRKPWWHFAFLGLSAVGSLAALTGLIVALVGMFGSSAAPPPSPSPTAHEPADVGPFDLSGMPRSLGRYFHPAAVMIDNLEASQPQAGLQRAAVVYEALVEGSATRFLAVIEQDELDRIGPVRSARPYFLAWAAEFGALYVHAGGSPEALAQLRNGELHDLNALLAGSRYFWRDTARRSPHNLYTKDDLLTFAIRDEGLEGGAAVEPLWAFDDTPPSGELANEVTVEFASSVSRHASYAYDSKMKTYTRSTAGQPHNDELTGKPITVRNVVIEVIPAIQAVGEKGRLTLEVTGSGPAVIVRDGVAIRGEWRKPELGSKTVFVDAAGEPIPLGPGNTWIEVLPAGYSFTYR